MQCYEQKLVTGTKYFLKAELLLKMSSAAGYNKDRWQRSIGKRTCLILSKINSQNDSWWTEHEQGNLSFDTVWIIGDEKNLCQDVSQESHRATAACVNECLCWSAGTSSSRPRVNGPSYHCWRELVFPIWSRDQHQCLEWRSKGSPRPKKARCPSQKWNACLCASLSPWVLFTKSGCTDSQSMLLHKNSSKTEEKRHVGSSKHGEKRDPEWRQCAIPCSALCSAVFWHLNALRWVAASLLTWSRTLRLLFISKSKISSERVPLWVNGRHPESCNAGCELHPTCFLPGMLQTMAAPLWKVCAGTRDVTWKWPHCSWWINEINFLNRSHYFIVRPGKIKLSCLFEVRTHKAIQSNAVPWFAFLQKYHAPTMFFPFFLIVNLLPLPAVEQHPMLPTYRLPSLINVMKFGRRDIKHISGGPLKTSSKKRRKCNDSPEAPSVRLSVSTLYNFKNCVCQ